MALTTNSNHTVLRGGGQGGHLYTGVEPIVVNNQEYKISANTAALGVESPLYFSVDTPTQTVISFSGDGQPYSAGENISVENHIISGKDWTPELNEKLDITAYEQGDTAFYSAGSNIDITDHVISGKDWNPEINNASSYALSEAINQMQGYPSGVDNITPDIVTSYISGGLLHISAKDWSDDITAASANALNEAINQITAVELANSALTAQTAINANHAAYSDSATYDSLGRKIVDTYLTAHQELPDWTPTIQNASGNAYNSAVNWVVDQHYLTAVTGDNTPYTAGANIAINDHVVSGKDWTDDIQSASSYAYDQATAQIPAVTGLPYVENSALDYTPGGHLVSSISGDAIHAVSAEGALTAETANYTYVAESANYVAAGWEYNASNEITGYSGSAFHAESPSEGKIYTGISPIVVDNSTTTGTISAQTARLGVQSPLYFVEDTSASTVIGISGLPEVEGVMYESALGLSDGYITGYNNSALSSERSRYAVSSTSANGAISSQTASIVTGGWESANGKITGYNGTAFYTGAGSTYDVKAGSNINVATAGTTFTVSGKDWTNTITAASSYAYDHATAVDAGRYIPWTEISVGASGTQAYNVSRGIRVTAASGWTEMYCQNKENENEAHLQVGQNYSGNKSFWAEIDGAGGGLLQMNWNSGTISPNSHSSYSDGTTAAISLGNGALVYRSANSALKSLDDEASKVWQLGSERLRLWNSHGSASFGPTFTDVVNTDIGCYWALLTTDNVTKLRIHGPSGSGDVGTVDLTPGFINFYDYNGQIRATLNPDQINALKALLNHVQSASASWANPSVATGSI